MDAGEFYKRASNELDRLCANHEQALRALGSAQRVLNQVLMEVEKEATNVDDADSGCCGGGCGGKRDPLALDHGQDLT